MTIPLSGFKKVKFRHMGCKGDARFVYDTLNGRYNPWVEGRAVDLDRRNYLDTPPDEPAEVPLLTAPDEDTVPF